MSSVVDGAALLLRSVRRAWRQLRAWRRIRFTSGGLVFTVGAFAVGFAAINTGNNLLYLLLGAMLGFIAVSSWFSERMIRNLQLRREAPRGATVGQELRIGYTVKSLGGRLPILAVEVAEAGLHEHAFVARIQPGGTAEARSYHRFDRRGIHALDAVTLSTAFPFGLFHKERDVSLPGELVIWPRSDRPVRPPVPAVGNERMRALSTAGAPGARGEYRSMHEYRPGDEPRDIHWKSSARLRSPVVREYDADASKDFWICLDLSGQPGDAAEALVEVAASLAAMAVHEGRSFGLAAGSSVLRPASGPGHLERALDVLARVEFRPDASAPSPPEDASKCVLVSLSGRGRERFADAYVGTGPG